MAEVRVRLGMKDLRKKNKVLKEQEEHTER